VYVCYKCLTSRFKPFFVFPAASQIKETEEGVVSVLRGEVAELREAAAGLERELECRARAAAAREGADAHTRGELDRIRTEHHSLASALLRARWAEQGNAE
jgi:hypothetical protein